jgi:hypothetical protein
MSQAIALLRDLHRMHCQLADIQGQLERGPRQIKAAQAQVAHVAESINQAKQAIRQKKMDADRKQLQLREREAKIRDLGNKLNSANSNREYQALKDQIAADEQANSVLSDEILETLEEIDSLDANLKELVVRLSETEAEEKRVQSTIRERLVSLQQDQERVQADLKSSEAQLAGDFKTEYARVVVGRGEDAMAEVEGQSCGGCYTVLTSQALDRLLVGKPVTCSSCGRLLYSPEGR